MKKIIIALVAVLFAFPAFAVEIGQQAPDFETQDTEGKTFRLNDNKGQIVVLEWQSPECPFSLAQYHSGSIQALQKFANENKIIWVTINSSAPGKPGNETRQQARDEQRKQHSAAAHIILDPEGDIGHKYDAKTTPHMFVIDKDGKLAYMGAIDDKPGEDDAAVKSKADNYVYDALNALLKGGVPVKQVTKPYGCAIKYAD